jgi:hypothetical protein
MGQARSRRLDESVEEETTGSRGSPVEPECEFVEVVVEVPLADRSVVGSEPPPLEERGNSVNPGHSHMGWQSGASQARWAVTAAVARQGNVARPAVGANEASLAHRALNKGIRLSMVASLTTAIRMRPVPCPRTSAAIATIDRITLSRPSVSVSALPTNVSSTSTSPVSRPRPGRTLARLSLWSHDQEVR